MYVSVRRVSVSVSTLLGVLFGIFDLLLLYYFFALDHAPAAILTVVMAFLTGHAAAWAIVVVNDLGTDDLFLCLLVGSEAQASRDPLDKLIQNDEGSRSDGEAEYHADGQGDGQGITNILDAHVKHAREINSHKRQRSATTDG